MSKLYIEPFSGISGNMLMGALFDLGASFPKVKAELEKLSLGEYTLVFEKVDKCGIHATHFDVVLPEIHHHHHEEEHHHHEHSEGHHHHEKELVKAQPQVHEHAHAHRNLADILHIINSSALSDKIKAQAAAIFTELGKAEAKVHGKALEEIHFHEVGAIDTIIDVVGNLLALEDLGITEIYVGRLQTGKGFVRCAHGLMPIPAPATAELLQGLPYYQGDLDKELVTPTGAVLVHALAKVSLNLPEDFSSAKIGYGAGTWDLPIPNVVRLYLDKNQGTTGSTEEKLIVGECNLDDTTGEVCGYTASKLLAAGALDAWYTPIFMKKGRPAYKLAFLCAEEKLETVKNIVFTETSTLGIRSYKVARTALVRKFYEVTLPQGQVKVKAGYYAGQLVNLAPEYSDCVKIAESTLLPLQTIMAAAVEEGRKIAVSKL